MFFVQEKERKAHTHSRTHGWMPAHAYTYRERVGGGETDRESGALADGQLPAGTEVPELVMPDAKVGDLPILPRSKMHHPTNSDLILCLWKGRGTHQPTHGHRGREGGGKGSRERERQRERERERERESDRETETGCMAEVMPDVQVADHYTLPRPKVHDPANSDHLLWGREGRHTRPHRPPTDTHS
jgi:hypothetical protein